MCALACEFGFKVKNGCPICACEGMLNITYYIHCTYCTYKRYYTNYICCTYYTHQRYYKEKNTKDIIHITYIVHTLFTQFMYDAYVDTKCRICICSKYNAVTLFSAPFEFSELKQECPPVTCDLACEFGFKVENGCPICACKDMLSTTYIIHIIHKKDIIQITCIVIHTKDIIHITYVVHIKQSKNITHCTYYSY